MSNDDNCEAPKQLLWADTEQVIATAMQLRRDGYSNKQIAAAMEISIDAVERVLTGRSADECDE